MSLHRYVQLARLRLASKRLANSEGQSVADIALDSGYETPDAFARAFRRRFRQSPSSFRKCPDWEPWLKAFGPLNSARSEIMPTTFTLDEVTVREVAPTRVAIFEHRGDPKTLDVTIQKFIAWRKTAGMSSKTNPNFNIWHTERRPANPADYRMEQCVGVGADHCIDPADETVRVGEILGGRCAVLRVTSDTHNLEHAALYLYRD